MIAFCPGAGATPMRLVGRLRGLDPFSTLIDLRASVLKANMDFRLLYFEIMEKY